MVPVHGLRFSVSATLNIPAITSGTLAKPLRLKQCFRFKNYCKHTKFSLNRRTGYASVIASAGKHLFMDSCKISFNVLHMLRYCRTLVSHLVVINVPTGRYGFTVAELLV